jgi:hypothetical protein
MCLLSQTSYELINFIISFFIEIFRVSMLESVCRCLLATPSLTNCIGVTGGDPVVYAETGSAFRPSVSEVTVLSRHLYVRQHFLRIDEGSS